MKARVPSIGSSTQTWSAHKPLVEAAGGRFTDWRGAAPHDADGRVLAVGDARLTIQALPLLGLS